MYHSDFMRYGQWYRMAHEYIRTMYGHHADLFCDVLAATSPRVSVKANWKSAKRLVACWIETGAIDHSAVIMRTHLPNVKRAFRREPLSGDKVSRFAANLKGNWDCVTIDVWVCKHYGVNPHALTPKLYKTLERRIRKDAKRHGVSPCEHQATLWQLTRMKDGRKPTSFLAASFDDRQFLFQWA